MTLVEILVTLVIGTIVCTIAYAFYRNFMGHLERQKQVTSLQEGIRNAVDCINRYLVAGGVSGDSLFFDPHKKLAIPFVNGGHRVFDVAEDSGSISVYGNYSGGAGNIASPILDKKQRWLKTDKAGLFRVGGYAYIYAGSAQEVARIVSINDSMLTVENDFFAPYPKGTLIFPLERVRIYAGRARRSPGLAGIRRRIPDFRPRLRADQTPRRFPGIQGEVRGPPGGTGGLLAHHGGQDAAVQYPSRKKVGADGFREGILGRVE